MKVNLVILLVCTVSVFLPNAFAEIKVETVVDGLNIPWELVFAPDDSIYFTERDGKLWHIEDDGTLKLIAEFPASNTYEGGLLGLALDPDFEKNNFLYLYQTYVEFPSHQNKVVRFTISNDHLKDEVILIDNIPGALWHDGGRIHFGPDGMLYISTGDAINPSLSQDIKSLAGKILRINNDGTIPDDNPFENSSVFSYGHRNPQGFDWHPESKILVATEHGPSGERGRAHDEVNVIYSGKNYGWPEIIGDETREGLENPIIHTGDATWAPSGAAFYDSQNILDWYGKYFVATLRGEHLRMLDLDLENNQVKSSTALFSGEFGRLRSANMSPEGDLYILTSNQDGRGDPTSNDDRILKITPIITSPKGDSSMPPLKQIQSGILAENVSCKIGMSLVFKQSNQMPVCVMDSSVDRLRQIGWAK